MNEELERVKLSLQNINHIIEAKGNPVVASVLMAPIKKIPIFGDLIDSFFENYLNNFQKEKEQELINVILKRSNAVTSEKVNDVEFIINYARVVEAVKRLATNDKVKFFGNLIRNGYLELEHINNSEFEEYLDILNTMSYREIKYLIDYKEYCDNKAQHIQRKWKSFSKDYANLHGIDECDLYYAFTRMKRTGFLEEDFEISGVKMKNDFTFRPLNLNITGFHITERFLRFFNMVLKISE